MNLTVGKLAVIDWLDAVGPADLDPGESLAPAPVRTVGWVWEVTDTYVTLAAEVFPDAGCRAATTVLWSMVTQAREIPEE